MLHSLPYFFALTLSGFSDGSSRACPNGRTIEEALMKVHTPFATIIVVSASDMLYEQAYGCQGLSFSLNYSRIPPPLTSEVGSSSKYELLIPLLTKQLWLIRVSHF